MLSLIEFALYIAYIYFSFLRRRFDRRGIKINFILSSLIAGVNFVELVFIPKTSQSFFSIIITVFVIIVFSISAKRYYDMMD